MCYYVHTSMVHSEWVLLDFWVILNVYESEGWYETNIPKAKSDDFDYDKMDDDERPFSINLAKWVKKYFKPKEVVDIGCGSGLYVNSLRDQKIKAVGYDINPIVKGKKYLTKKSIFDVVWSNNGETYRDLFLENEIEQSSYNFDYANTNFLKSSFKYCEEEAKLLIEKKLVIPAYEKCIKASHLFNMLDARGVIGVSERAAYIKRVREISKNCCEVYILKQGI